MLVRLVCSLDVHEEIWIFTQQLIYVKVNDVQRQAMGFKLLFWAVGFQKPPFGNLTFSLWIRLWYMIYSNHDQNWSSATNLEKGPTPDLSVGIAMICAVVVSL